VRIAVIADTHLPRGARRLPPACLDELAEADLILHAGDVVTAEALDELAKLAPVEAVYGNMDEAALSARLSERSVVEAAGVRIGMVHIAGPAAGRVERLAGWFPDCDAIVYGHTHIPHVERRDGCWILNPGSPTERRRAPARAMLRLAVRSKAIDPELVTFPA
jgi:uncharacterized protein